MRLYITNLNVMNVKWDKKKKELIFVKLTEPVFGDWIVVIEYFMDYMTICRHPVQGRIQDFFSGWGFNLGRSYISDAIGRIYQLPFSLKAHHYSTNIEGCQ